MNQNSLRVLEYGKVADSLSAETDTSLGAEVASRLVPFTDLNSVLDAQQETTEAKSLISSEAMPFGGVHDIRQSVDKATRDGILQPREFLDIMDTLAAARKLRGFVLKRKDIAPTLARIAADVVVLDGIEHSIEKAISDTGEVRDTASDKLASIRGRMRAVHNRLSDKMQSIIQSSQFRTALQEAIITIRDDRYCVPVKAEFRNQVPGIVHDTSASGATLFIEPSAVVELGNDLKEQALKEREEIERILRKLAERVAERAEEILVNTAIVARLDFISAKAKLSFKQHAVQPDLNTRSYLRLVGARHPLLTGEVVPIDIEVGGRFRGLLITGPNTGGKTVALKTVGLLSLMAQSGLHVPAEEGTELAVFEQVFADIGDEQSIEQSLSTFSSHVGNIVRMIRALSGSAIVLLDEIGAGTDPAEGAALAKAMLDYLLSRGTRVIATTHYGELKEFAFVRDDIENACVEFDAETLRPTYHVLMGVPGRSNAMAVARRLGMPDEVIAGAEDSLAGRADSTDETIRKIEDSHRAALERERFAERASSDAETLRRRYEDRVQKVESERATLEQRLRKESQEMIARYEKRLNRALLQLEKLKSHGKRAERLKAEVKQTLSEASAKVAEVAEPEIEEEFEGPFEPKVGDRVRLAGVNQEGTLLELGKDDRAVVQVGPLRVDVSADSLRPARSKKPEPEHTGATQATAIALVKAQDVSPELKLIAQRAEEALENLDKYMDDAYAAGLTQVRIIHGKGTGVLRNIVWKFLKDHPAVQSYRLGELEEGGSGATVVELKN